MLEGILKETYGIFVYQEQVMQAAQVLAGYSLGEADLLRRAMGKKIKSEMDAQRERFVDGCAADNGIAAAKANELFDLIDKFAGYGFNKSHAAAYALLAYQTAWLKAHHRADFYAASMCFDTGLTDKLGVLRRGHAPLRRRVPAARHQRQPCEFHGRGRRGPLRARRAQGRRREGDGGAGRRTGARRPVRSLDDFAARIDPRLLNRRQLESLAAAGAFDDIEPNRAAVFAAAETMLADAACAHDQRTSGQDGLFGANRPMPRRSACRRRVAGRSPSGWRPSATRSVSISPRTRSTVTSPLAAHKARTFADLAALPRRRRRAAAR